MFNKVFISYASEDLTKATELYNYLLTKQYSPWLDKEKLQVGDSWDLKIRHALKSADFVIVLLSANSINKRGYVQREFNLALRYLEEKLIDDVYILPVLLDECNVPEQLQSIQWIKYEEKNFFNKILGALEGQRKIYFNITPQAIIDLKNSNITEKLDIINAIKNHVECSVEYPVFAANNFWEVKQVNETIKSKAVEICNKLCNFYFEDPSFFESKGFDDRYLNVTYTISSITETHLSILFAEVQHWEGEHPKICFHSLNFLFNPTYLINPRSHFNHTDIREIVTSRLFSDSLKAEDKNQCGDLSSYLEDQTYNLEFTINENKIELILANNLPHVILGCGFFSIGYIIKNHKILLQLPNKLHDG